jgi:hypothetical protein
MKIPMKTKNTRALERHHLIWACTGKDQAGIRGYILQISDKKNLLVCTQRYRNKRSIKIYSNFVDVLIGSH